jgi:hypothetical protein
MSADTLLSLTAQETGMGESELLSFGKSGAFPRQAKGVLPLGPALKRVGTGTEPGVDRSRSSLQASNFEIEENCAKDARSTICFWHGSGCARRRSRKCCAVLCCAVLWCAVLCCAVVCCTVRRCGVLCCGVLYCTVLCCAVLCCAVLCCALLCFAVLCCAVLCCAVLC